MKVHAFKVDIHNSNPLEDVLDLVNKQPNLRQRIKIVGTVEMRAEYIEHRDGLWLIDFVRIRTDHGPGKVGRSSQIQGIPFNTDEGFGEETAALYDPLTGYMLIQYNHFGVRAGSIGDYLSIYDGSKTNVYSLNPKFDNDVERRLAKKGITKKIALSIDISKMNDKDRLAGTPLSEAISIGRDANANKISIVLSAGGGKSKSLSETASSIFNSAKTLFRMNPEAVTKLEFRGKDDKDSVIEVIDLIGQRLSVSFDKLKPGADLRYPREERWTALIRAKNGWKDDLV